MDTLGLCLAIWYTARDERREGGRGVVMLSLNCAVCSGAIHLSAAASLIGHLVMRLHKDKLAAPLASQPGFALVSSRSELSFIAHGQGRSFQLSALLAQMLVLVLLLLLGLVLISLVSAVCKLQLLLLLIPASRLAHNLCCCI